MRGTSKSERPVARLDVRVTPRAPEDAVLGWQGDTLLVRVRAPAQGGQANEAVCRLLAQKLRLPRAAVSITYGLSSRRKLVKVDGMDRIALAKRLTAT